MYRKRNSKWLKHWDFILSDVIMLQISYVIAYLLRNGMRNPYSNVLYLSSAIMIVLTSLCFGFFLENYRGILRKGYWQEFKAVVQHVACVSISIIVYLFIAKTSDGYSRIFMLYFPGISVCLVYISRLLLKGWLKNHKGPASGKRAVMIVALEENYREVVDTFRNNPYSEFRIIGVGLLREENLLEKSYREIPIVINEENIIEFLRASWVDEVLFSVPWEYPIPRELIHKCFIMGITTHLELAKISSDLPNQIVERIEGRTVLSSSIKMATSRQAFLKRALDIFGAIVGLFFTGILTIIIGPIIYIKSPGPIFFTQIRMGKNGRKFKMYKFRSMYMNAEEQKAQLMSENRMTDGLMFKMEDDPRIIDGIGHFIRKTSLDEFPQFWNVLKGEMSLVGTRPPTEDEWEKYALHHRARLAVKPGITGLWQVSGRSEITDFEEVVKLDAQYIRDWNFGQDIKILLQTIGVVFGAKGSM